MAASRYSDNVFLNCPFDDAYQSKTGLPRFNMPLELGMFLGGKRFGRDRQRAKVCLILDKEPYRYQTFVSDIAGQNIRSHGNDRGEAITLVRNWLRDSSGRKTIPGGREISRHYEEYRADLPEMCAELKIEEDELTFNDYTNLVSEWLREVG